MSTQLAAKQADAKTIETVLMQGDLSKLSPEQRLSYYKQTCESLNLNPMTRPFEYITLNGKLTLYVKRDGTDQLRRIHNVSVKIVSRERVDDLLVITAQASLPSGRVDESVGAVNIKNLQGEALGNAMMKAETKAKRRVTLSICGLGFMDESEMPAHFPPVTVDGPLLPPKQAEVLPPAPVSVERPSSFRETKDPNDLLSIAKQMDEEEKLPRAAVPEVTHIATLLKADIVDPGDYVIQTGSLRGTKLSSKSKDFWLTYEAELSHKIKNDVPKEFMDQAIELKNRIQDYLMAP